MKIVVSNFESAKPYNSLKKTCKCLLDSLFDWIYGSFLVKIFFSRFCRNLHPNLRFCSLGLNFKVNFNYCFKTFMFNCITLAIINLLQILTCLHQKINQGIVIVLITFHRWSARSQDFAFPSFLHGFFTNSQFRRMIDWLKSGQNRN